jgi:hypothetical protein
MSRKKKGIKFTTFLAGTFFVLFIFTLEKLFLIPTLAILFMEASKVKR